LNADHAAGRDVLPGGFHVDGAGDVVEKLTQDGAVGLAIVVAEPVGVFPERVADVDHVGVFGADFRIDEDLVHSSITTVWDFMFVVSRSMVRLQRDDVFFVQKAGLPSQPSGGKAEDHEDVGGETNVDGCLTHHLIGDEVRQLPGGGVGEEGGGSRFHL
jgi:hypothetical protein